MSPSRNEKLQPKTEELKCEYPESQRACKLQPLLYRSNSGVPKWPESIQL